MSEKDKEAVDIVNCSPESIRSIISLQQERYHHIQSLSLGLISAFLTVLTVAITGYSILRPDLPEIPLEEAAISKITGPNLLLPIWAATLILILNYLISWVLITIALVMAVTAISNLLDILTKGPLNQIINFPLAHIISREDETSPTLNLSTTYINYFRERIQRNQLDLENMNDLFVKSVLRIIVCLLMVFLPFYIRTLGSNVELLEIFLLNIIFITPTPVDWIMSHIWGSDTQDSEEDNEGLFQELASGKSNGRWDLPDITIWENLLFSLVFVLSLISVLISMLGYIL